MPPVAFTAAEYVTPRDPAADVAALGELVRQFPVRYVITVVPSTIAAARSLAQPGVSGYDYSSRSRFACLESRCSRSSDPDRLVREPPRR